MSMISMVINNKVIIVKINAAANMIDCVYTHHNTVDINSEIIVVMKIIGI